MSFESNAPERIWVFVFYCNVKMAIFCRVPMTFFNGTDELRGLSLWKFRRYQDFLSEIPKETFGIIHGSSHFCYSTNNIIPLNVVTYLSPQ